MCCSLHDLRVDVSVLLHHVFHNVWKDHEETSHYILVIRIRRSSLCIQHSLTKITTRFSDPRHTTVLTQCIYSKCSCTCSSYRHFLLVFHQEVLHYLSRLQDIQTRCVHQPLKITLWISACVYVSVCLVTFWSTCAGVTFSRPL